MATCTYNPGINSVNPYVTLKVTQLSVNLALNQSSVRWELILYRPSAISSAGSKNYSVIVNDQTHTGTTTIGGSGTKTIASGTQTVKHNSDGSKTINISFSLQMGITWSGVQITTAAASGSMVLSPIAQATTPQLDETSVKLGVPVSIVLPAASANYKHDIRYRIGNGPYTTALEKVSGTVSFTFPKTVASAFPNALTASATMLCITYDGTRTVGQKEISFTATVSDDAVPSVTISRFKNSDSALSSKFGNLIIKGKSKINVVITTAGAYGSTIKKRVAKFGGGNYSSWDSNTINIGYSEQSGNVPCTVTVTDSRGRTATATANVTVTNYTPPQIISFLVERSGSDGTADDGGTYAYASCNLSIDALSNKNDKSYKIEYRETSAAAWTQVASGSVYTLNSKINCGNILNVDKSYLFRLTVTDYFSSVYVDTSVSTAFTLVDYHSSGRGISFGKVAEAADLMDVALPMRVHRFDTPVINTGSINDMVYSGSWYLANGVTDKPGNQNGYLTVTRYNASYIYQRFVSYAGKAWERIMEGGTWQDWCGTFIEDFWTTQKQMDGVMVSTGYFVKSFGIRDAWFDKWRKSPTIVVQYPYKFLYNPMLNFSVVSWNGSGGSYPNTVPLIYATEQSTTSVTVQMQTYTSNVGVDVQATVVIQAVGRWK